MDELQSKGLIDTATRSELLGNTLVLVAPKSSAAAPAGMKKGVDLRPLLGEHGRIALALVDSVPAGKSAQAALTSMDMWDHLAPRTAQGANVRAALQRLGAVQTPTGVARGRATGEGRGAQDA